MILESWCKSAVTLRNFLAHHSRIWNRNYPIQPQLSKNLNGLWIDVSNVANNKLYAQISCLAYIQNAIHPNNDFKQKLKDLLAVYTNVDVTAMGFPVDWELQPLWM